MVMYPRHHWVASQLDLVSTPSRRPPAAGFLKLQEMRAGGVPHDVIRDYVGRKSETFAAMGVPPDKISQHWGAPEPDDTEMRRLEDRERSSAVWDGHADATEMPGFFKAMTEYGYPASLAGMYFNEALPEKHLPEDAPWSAVIGAGLGEIVPDLPVFGAPWALGLKAGGPKGAAAAFAFHSGLKQAYIDSLSRGEVDDFDEFMYRASSMRNATVKGAGMGYAAGWTGGKIRAWPEVAKKWSVVTTSSGQKVTNEILEEIATTTARRVSAVAAPVGEAGALTVAGGVIASAEQGRIVIPTRSDFVHSAVLIGALHLGSRGVKISANGVMKQTGTVLQRLSNARNARVLTAKLQRIWARTGVSPEQVREDARSDHSIIEDLSSGRIVPRRYEGMVDGADAILASAAEVVARTRSANVRLLRRELEGVSVQEARMLLSQLEEAGVLGEQVWTGGFFNRPVKVDTVEQARGLVNAEATLRTPEQQVQDLARRAEAEPVPEGEAAAATTRSSVIEQRVQMKIAEQVRRGDKPNEQQVRLDVIAEDFASGFKLPMDMRQSLVGVFKAFAGSRLRGEEALDVWVGRLSDDVGPLAVRAEVVEAAIHRLRQEGLLPEPPRPESPEVVRAREAVAAIRSMKVAELREKGLLPTAKSRKRDLIAAAEKRVEELARQAETAAPKPAERAPLDEVSLEEQVAEIQALMAETRAADVKKLEGQRRRLDALQERIGRQRRGEPRYPEESEASIEVVRGHISDPAGKPRTKWSWSQFYKEWKDQHWFAKKYEDMMEGGTSALGPLDSVYTLLRLGLGVEGKAAFALEWGTFKFGTFETTGPGLRQILKPVRKDISNLDVYLVAARRVEVGGRLEKKYGRKKAEEIERKAGDIPIKDARRSVETLEKEFGSIAEELYQYQDNILQYYRDAGMVDASTYKLIKELNKNYVPYFRVLLQEPSGVVGAGKGLPGVRPLSQKLFRLDLEGSELKIGNPVESIIKNTHALIYAAEQNAVRDAFLRQVHKTGYVEGNKQGLEVLARRVKAETRAIPLSPREILQLTKQLKDGEVLTAEQKSALEEEVFSIFRPDTIVQGQNQITWFRDGKREVWEVPPEIAEVLESTNLQEMGMLVKILGMPARTLRAGAVLTPEFQLHNPLRDTMVAFIQSDNGFNFMADSIWGAFAVAGKTQLYRQWMLSGGAMSELVAIDRLFLRSDVQRATGHTWDKGYRKFARNVVLTPIEALRIVSQMTEQMTRVGEFGRALRKDGRSISVFRPDLRAAANARVTMGLYKETAQDVYARLSQSKYTPWMESRQMPERPASKEDIMRAGLASRDISVDFGRIGTRARSVNRLVAFFNAGLEGTDRMVRALRDNPIRTTLRASMILSMPSLYLYITNQDEYGWDKITRRDRDLFWHFPTYVEDENGNLIPAPNDDEYIEKNGHSRPLTAWHKLRKPWTWGMIFATGPERAYDFIIRDDPHAFDDFEDALLASAAFNFVPQAALPALESWANKSVFSGRPIVPANVQGLLSRMEHTPHTTPIAIWLGKQLSTLPFGISQYDLPGIGPLDRSGLASPVKIDNFVRNWSAGLGQHFTEQLSNVLVASGAIDPTPGARAAEGADVIGIGSFVSRTGGWTDDMVRFSEAVRDYTEVEDSVKKAYRDHEFALAEELIEQYTGSVFASNGKPLSEMGSPPTKKFAENLRDLNSVYKNVGKFPLKFITLEQRTLYQDGIRNAQHSVAVRGWQRWEEILNRAEGRAR